jgi:NADPH:quinone reductase-like Zn-dependent oxidoreductase
MKAIQISQAGGADVLKISDVERPSLNNDQALN